MARCLIEKSSNTHFPVAILGVDQFAAEIARRLSMSQLAHCRVACFVALPGQTVSVLDSPVLEWNRLDDVVGEFRPEVPTEDSAVHVQTQCKVRLHRLGSGQRFVRKRYFAPASDPGMTSIYMRN